MMFSKGPGHFYRETKASTLLFAADPSVNGILVESPDPADPNGWNFAFRCILADGNFMQF